MRAVMNQAKQANKLETYEELASVRAGVALAKKQMADESKRHDVGRNFKKN